MTHNTANITICFEIGSLDMQTTISEQLSLVGGDAGWKGNSFLDVFPLELFAYCPAVVMYRLNLLQDRDRGHRLQHDALLNKLVALFAQLCNLGIWFACLDDRRQNACTEHIGGCDLHASP